jgi:hypothetical protein
VAASGADVRVVDFGAAKIGGSSRMTRSGVVFGTPHYMSPEQASGQSVDHRSDVYALGVTMYEMFTGKVPFEADTYMGVLTQHMFVQPERPSHVGQGAKDLGALEDITLACLAKKPEDRFASMAALVEAIDGATRERTDTIPDSSGSVAPPPRISAAPAALDRRGADDGPRVDGERAAIPGISAPPSLWMLWGAVAVAAALVGILALRLVLRRDSPQVPVVAIATTVPPRPVASIAEPLPPEAPSVAASAVAPAAAPPSAAPTPAPSAHRTVHVREGSAGPRVPIDDVGDPFAEKR